MHIYSVADAEFKPYGKVLEGYDTAELLAAMEKIEMPAEGTAYEPGIDSLEACAVFADFRDRAYGGMPIQLGMCWGHNENGVLDTAKVKAFRVPKGAVIEVYATTLHFAPCHTCPHCGFRVAVVLPKGTNTEKPVIEAKNEEDKWLWARNKWLLAHPESNQAKRGAHIGLSGENIDIKEDI